MLLNRSLLAGSAILLAFAANATPTINNVQWNTADRTATISGLNFGDFNGEVVSWDDFEDHAIGTNINGLASKRGHTWTTLYNYNGDGISVDDTYSVSGSKSLHLKWGTDSNTIRAFGWSGKGPYNKLYITYWRRMTGDFDKASDNHKQFYLYGNNGEFPQLMPLLPAGTDKWGVYNNVGDPTVTWALRNNINGKQWLWDNTINKFQRWEFLAILNSPYTERNGTIKVWLDGELGIENYSYQMRAVDGEFIDFRLGHMAMGFQDSAEAWFDDVYIATTTARVEACESNIYEECTMRQIQDLSPTNWSDTSITINVRNIPYLKGKKVYLYVIDSNGTVSNSIEAPSPKM